MPVHFSKRQANRRRARSNPCRSGALFRPESVPVSRISPPWAWQAAETGMSHRWAPGPPTPQPTVLYKTCPPEPRPLRTVRPSCGPSGWSSAGSQSSPSASLAYSPALYPPAQRWAERGARTEGSGWWRLVFSCRTGSQPSPPAARAPGCGDVLLGAVTGLHTHRPSHTWVDGAPPGGAAAGDRDTPRRTGGGQAGLAEAAAFSGFARPPHFPLLGQRSRVCEQNPGRNGSGSLALRSRFLRAVPRKLVNEGFRGLLGHVTVQSQALGNVRWPS